VAVFCYRAFFHNNLIMSFSLNIFENAMVSCPWGERRKPVESPSVAIIIVSYDEKVALDLASIMGEERNEEN
jgi:hypothetical protein